MKGFPARRVNYESLRQLVDDERVQKYAAVTAAVGTAAVVGVVAWSKRGKFEINRPRISWPKKVEMVVEDPLPGDDPNVYLAMEVEGGEEIDASLEGVELNPLGLFETEVGRIVKDAMEGTGTMDEIDHYINELTRAQELGLDEQGETVPNLLERLQFVRARAPIPRIEN